MEGNLRIWFLVLSLGLFGAGIVQAQDALDIEAKSINGDLVVHFKSSKDSKTLINSPQDSTYLWNENDDGYRYYMVGAPALARENFWTGV